MGDACPRAAIVKAPRTGVVLNHAFCRVAFQVFRGQKSRLGSRAGRRQSKMGFQALGVMWIRGFGPRISGAGPKLAQTLLS